MKEGGDYGALLVLSPLIVVATSTIPRGKPKAGPAPKVEGIDHQSAWLPHMDTDPIFGNSIQDHGCMIRF